MDIAKFHLLIENFVQLVDVTDNFIYSDEFYTII